MSEQNPSAASLLDPGERQYDVVVSGAGAVGENVADRVAQAGLSVDGPLTGLHAIQDVSL